MGFLSRLPRPRFGSGRLAPEGPAETVAEQAGILAAYEELLTGRDPRRIVVLGPPTQESLDLARALIAHHPKARVLVLVGGTRTLPPKLESMASAELQIDLVAVKNLRGVLAAVLRWPAADVLIDHGGTPASLRHGVFSHLFPSLADGGQYLLLDGGASGDGDLNDREEESLPDFLERLSAAAADPGSGAPLNHDDTERVQMTGPRRICGRVVAVGKVGRHVVKLREENADEVLTARVGVGWGDVLAVRPPVTFESRARLHSNRPELDGPLLGSFDVPARTLRVYHDVVCMPRQLALVGDTLIPASFHHPMKFRLRNRGSIDAARWFARLRQEPQDEARLDGTWYHLASEFPGHFGHVMTEDLSRLWGIDQARRRFGKVRVLVGAGDPQPPGFLVELLAAYGIPADDVVAAPGPVRVERLVTATPQLHNDFYIDPEITDTWRRVANSLVEPSSDVPRRIFVSRPDDGARRCVNGPELERRFADAGFHVVRPEQLSLVEQFSMFAEAEVVAGYAGSGLFTALASRPGIPVIVFASETYKAVNEWLISSVQGFQHHQFWCPSTQEWTSTGFDREAFHADFIFDVDRDGAQLDDLLHDLAR